MENEIQTNNTPIQQVPQTPVLPLTNRLKALLFILLGLIVITVSVFVYIQVVKKKIPNPPPITVLPTPNPTVTLPSPTIVAKPVKPTGQTSTPVKWLVYTHTKFPDLPGRKIRWKGFKFYYPSSWEIEVSRDENEPILIVKITKNNGDYFRIFQGSGGGGYCLFPDQLEYNTFEGRGTQYTIFKEIKKSNGIIWRLADWPNPNGLFTHQLCEAMSVSGYYDSTIIGDAQIKATTPESVQELYEILNKIEIID